MRLPVVISDAEGLQKQLEEARHVKPLHDILSNKEDWTLHWVDLLGYIPLRSLFSQPILLEESINDVKLVYESNHHLFHMDDETDALLYDLIKDRAYNAWYVITKEETKWDDNQNIVIWLEWVQRYYEL